MELWLVLECGYEDGAVGEIAAFKTYREANRHLKKMMNERDEEDRDWLWYDIKCITSPL